VARYAVRSTVERWVQASPRVTTIDGRVAEHGWRIVMLTRLVPVFPFNLQNYAYGLTRIGFWPYVITSSICMLPGTAAFTFAGGALSEGRGDIKRTLLFLGTAGVLLVLISLIPRWLQRRSTLAGDILKATALAAILGASRSCPDLRAEPFDAARLDAQLDEQAAAFLSNATKGLQPGAEGRTARVSSIFKWFAGDFLASGGVAAFLRTKAGPELSG